MKINNKLKQYIEENVFPEYKKNDQGHDPFLKPVLQ